MTARVALVGVPGAGKSAVAAELGRRWDCEVLDTDAIYQTRTGMTVAEAVIDDETAFRVAEEQIACESLSTDGAVVAVGAGALQSADVVSMLQACPVIWLDVGLAEAIRRSGIGGIRPAGLGNVRGQFHDMMKQRAPEYAAVADHTVSTDDKDVPAVADDIMTWEADSDNDD